MARPRYTTKEFIEKAIKIHGYEYDYSKVKYKTMHDNVIIICKTHGEFLQMSHNHLQNHGCLKCCNTYSDKEKFTEKANIKHENKYDYSLVDYSNVKTKVIINCLIHGEFEQTPNSHLSGHGCPKCSSSYKSNTEVFIKKSNVVHKNKYNYSLVNYTNSKTKVRIICPIHGEFKQIPNSHLLGRGCTECGMI